MERAWSVHCPEIGQLHSVYQDVAFCPNCGARNRNRVVRVPVNAAPPAQVISASTPIVIDDEVESERIGNDVTITFQAVHSTVDHGQQQLMLNTRVQARERQQARTATLSKRNDKISVTIAKKIRTTVFALQYCHTIFPDIDSDGEEKYRLSWTRHGKTAIALSNRPIADLDTFIDESILKGMQRPQGFVRSEQASIYLAVDWNEKEGPTKLPNSAKNASTVEELLQYFKPPSTANGTVMYLICERRTIIPRPLEDNIPIKKEAKIPGIVADTETSTLSSQAGNPRQRLRLICKRESSQALRRCPSASPSHQPDSPLSPIPLDLDSYRTKSPSRSPCP